MAVIQIKIQDQTYEVLEGEEGLFVEKRQGGIEELVRHYYGTVHEAKLLLKQILNTPTKQNFYARFIVGNEVDDFYLYCEKKNQQEVILTVEQVALPEKKAFLHAIQHLNNKAILYQKKHHFYHAIYVTNSYLTMMDEDVHDLLKSDLNPISHVHYDDFAYLQEALDQLNVDMPHFDIQLNKKDQNRNWHAFAVDYSYMRLDEQEYIYATYEDITSLENAVKMADETVHKQHQEVHDHLTGLYDINTFLELLNDAMRENIQVHKCLEIISFDIVEFKVFNRTYGLSAGDILLKQFADILRQVFVHQRICRFDADHFYVIAINEDVVKKIKEVHDLLHKQVREFVEIRAGIYTLNADDISPGLAIERARVAGGEVAKDLRTYYRHYMPSMEDEQVMNNYIHTHLDIALEEGWIKTYYQPVAHTMSGKICGFEALARWQDPNYGMIAPNVFIKILEENHLIYKLDLFMIRNVAREMKAYLDAHRIVVPVSINLSRMDLIEYHIHERINDILEEYHIPHQFIKIEITETMVMHNEAFITKHIERFHEDGFEVWMDDFGSGSSSLNNLQRFDFDTLKLDMIFLRHTNKKSPHIIRSVIDMAKKLDMSTLAEGVENQQQLAFLRSIGCEKIQGYYLSQPLPSHQLISVLKEKGFELETQEEYRFYNQLAHVNILDPYHYLPEARFYAYGAIAIVEYENNVAETIYSNAAFEDYLHSYGIHSVMEADCIYNDPTKPYFHDIRDCLQRLKKLGDVVNYDFYSNDQLGRMYFQLVGDYSKRKAYLITCVDLAGATQIANMQVNKDIQQILYSFYDYIDIFDMQKNRVNHIYGNLLQPISQRFDGVKETIENYAHKLIAKEDQELFLQFMKPEKLEANIEKAPMHIIHERFHFLHSAQTTEIKEVIIAALTSMDNQKRYMVGIRKNLTDEHHRFIFPLPYKQAPQIQDIRKEFYKDHNIERYFDHCMNGIYIVNRDREILYWNKAATDITGFCAEDVVGKHCNENGLHHIDCNGIEICKSLCPFLYSFNDGRSRYEHLLLRHKRGYRVAVDIAFVPIKNEKGEVVAVLEEFKPTGETNVKDNIVLDMSQALLHDPLTKLPNRRYLQHMISYCTLMRQQLHLSSMVLFMDIDNFSHFNNIYGHNVGDQVLEALGEAMGKVVRKRDLFGRWGGEEFVGIFQIQHNNDTYAIATKIINIIRQIDILHAGEHLHITVSMGITTIHENDTPESVVERADQLMYIVKRSGKNSFIIE